MDRIRQQAARVHAALNYAGVVTVAIKCTCKRPSEQCSACPPERLPQGDLAEVAHEFVREAIARATGQKGEAK